MDSSKIKSFDYLLNEISGKNNNNNPKYSVFLGAGCSVSSGIPAGFEIIEILKKIIFAKTEIRNINFNSKSGYIKTADLINDYINNNKLNEKYSKFVSKKELFFKKKIEDNSDYYIKTISKKIQNNYKIQKKIDKEKLWSDYKKLIFLDCIYGLWFEEFNEDERERQIFIENLIEDIEPEGAYILFANIVKKNFIKNIFTTNFDDLINDALLKYAGLKPRVFAHNETAGYINLEDAKPNIIKVHGDYLFKNIKNTRLETARLERNMKEKFKETLEVSGLIVAGYNGADNSIMKILEKKKNKVNFSLLWCIRDQNYDSVNWRVKNLINNTKNSYIITINSFDHLMYNIWKKYDCGITNLIKSAEERENKIKTYLSKFSD